MKKLDVRPYQPTINDRISSQIEAIVLDLEEIVPSVTQTDFETPVAIAMALLQLDARQHRLHQQQLLQLLLMQGTLIGARLGMEHAAAILHQKDTAHSSP